MTDTRETTCPTRESAPGPALYVRTPGARAREAIRRLDRAGAPITYTPVARAAGVSRALLYRDPELRQTISRLGGSPNTTARPPAAQRMSQASRDELLAPAPIQPHSNPLQITVNGLIELHRRIARGFRNRHNYRLRMLLIGGGLQLPPPQV